MKYKLGYKNIKGKLGKKGDIETLKELGHISSEKEENKLRQHYTDVRDTKVPIQNEAIIYHNKQTTISFDRTDEWTDERGERHKESLPRIVKTFVKKNNIWKITKISQNIIHTEFMSKTHCSYCTSGIYLSILPNSIFKYHQFYTKFTFYRYSEQWHSVTVKFPLMIRKSITTYRLLQGAIKNLLLLFHRSRTDKLKWTNLFHNSRNL